jgi:hypothetical protein
MGLFHQSRMEKSGREELFLVIVRRASPSGKASAFQADIRRFESGRPLWCTIYGGSLPDNPHIWDKNTPPNGGVFLLTAIVQQFSVCLEGDEKDGGYSITRNIFFSETRCFQFSCKFFG